MDTLFAKAEAIRPLAKRRKLSGDVSHKRTKRAQTLATDETLISVSKHTSLPKSLRAADPPPENVPKHAHIANPKLRSELTRQSAHAARSKTLLKDAELLLTEDAGKMEVEGEMEKTWRVGQDEIVESAGQEAAKGRREWKLEGGPYKSRYSRNGRLVSLHLMLKESCGSAIISPLRSDQIERNLPSSNMFPNQTSRSGRQDWTCCHI
jgi:U3 small nucleolar RNA-associated protein 7